MLIVTAALGLLTASSALLFLAVLFLQHQFQPRVEDLGWPVAGSGTDICSRYMFVKQKLYEILDNI